MSSPIFGASGFSRVSPSSADLANLTWLLSDYTLDNGALGYVPGSHLLLFS